MTTPRRGEIWRVDLNPTKGSEITKVRPVLVISANSIGRLPIKLVVPITDWKEAYSNDSWHIKVEPSVSNGLIKTSCLDVLQTRAADISRFENKLGKLEPPTLEDVVTALMIVVDYQPTT